MLFNSLHFLIFFPIVILVYFKLPPKYRWALLLTASYYFYMSWKAEYAILILISTIVDYFSAIQIGKRDNGAWRKFFLIFSLCINLGLLFAFKYFNFFSEGVSNFVSLIGIQFSAPVLAVLLPVGISFYTFQTIGYTIDVYNRKIKPEKHFGIFAVYVSFFPQLVAGPIERAKNLLPQFFEKHNWDWEQVVFGLKLMLWGFFLKVVIADRLAPIVETVYGNVYAFQGWPLILATVFFAFQIFCDFAGYSFIAIGAARIMGFKLMENFRRPYHSQSISEFWKRWHISLSSWFKDYLYIPLGGSRVSIPKWYFNLFIVFVVSGFWHGANWTFLVWGGLHGFYLIFSIITKRYREKIKPPKIIKILITFFLVNISWVLFRANNLSEAWYVLTHLFKEGVGSLGVGSVEMGLAVGFIIFMELIHILQAKYGIRRLEKRWPQWIFWLAYLIILLLILLFGIFKSTEFIYFQF